MSTCAKNRTECQKDNGISMLQSKLMGAINIILHTLYVVHVVLRLQIFEIIHMVSQP